MNPSPAYDEKRTRRLHVGQGEHEISSDPDVMLSTILGSCVAMCLRDPVAGIGGMNHFLLPEGNGTGNDQSRRYGAYAMELLINALLQQGARRERMEAKLFGGGRMFDTLKDVGRSNADFAEKFMKDEGIPVVGCSLRGAGGRRVQYWPVSGRAMQRTVSDQQLPAQVIAPPPIVAASSGALELF